MKWRVDKNEIVCRKKFAIAVKGSRSYKREKKDCQTTKNKIVHSFCQGEMLEAESADQKAAKGKKSVAFKLFGRINFNPNTKIANENAEKNLIFFKSGTSG